MFHLPPIPWGLAKAITALLLPFIGALSITLLTTPIMRAIAIQSRIVDRPGERKVHRRPVARLGGLAIYAGFLGSAYLFAPKEDASSAFLIGSLMIIGIGLLDDIFEFRPITKLLGQMLAASVVVWFGVSISELPNPFGAPIYLGVFSMPLTILWIAGVTNAVNLIDGLDGLASGSAAISAGILAIIGFLSGQPLVAILGASLFGATLGFLRFNAAPASIFMGDVGSLFLGFSLATLSVIGVSEGMFSLSIWCPILILGLPISDTIFAIFRRLSEGRQIFQPDRAHFHHRLLDMGLSSKQVVWLLYFVSAVLGILGLLVSMTTGIVTYFILGFGLLSVWLFFLLCRRKKAAVLSFFNFLF